MNFFLALIACAGLIGRTDEGIAPPEPDVARLRELLQDHQRPRSQSQAALQLVQSHSGEAEALVRASLRRTETPEVFLALAAAIQLQRDARFEPELLAALTSSHEGARQGAAEALAMLPGLDLIPKLQSIVQDSQVELAARQRAVWTIGRIGTRAAAQALIDLLANDNESIRASATTALEELTGRTREGSTTTWKEWWESHKDMPDALWLQERLAFQTSRTHRLEGDLERAQAQVIRLHQQLHARLPVAERLAHVQALAEQEDAALRGLAVTWCTELLPLVDPVGSKSLMEVLLRLSGDNQAEVQRLAALALGRVNDPRALECLRTMLEHGAVSVRAAAVRGLAQQARGAGPEPGSRQKEIGPLLQKALGDSALEVVAGAAEELGSLGMPEAGPILVDLLGHSSAALRQTAAQALERIAGPPLIDSILARLDDPSAAVRFGLVGAIGKAAGDGRNISSDQKTLLCGRLETLLRRDADPGVRSRAASVLGECGSPEMLHPLWTRIVSSEDGRVQEKAWAAFLQILVRAGDPVLLNRWQETLREHKEEARLLQMLSEIWTHWQKNAEVQTALPALERELITRQLAQGKWAAAAAMVRDFLPRQTVENEREKGLRWLLEAARQAVQEGNAAEALHITHDAQPFLIKNGPLADEFDKLQKQSHQGDW
jgi:HEAT repeat protein